MAENSKISWTDHTFNFWMGCSEVHEGCDNCYARKMVGERYRKVQWGQRGTRVLTAPSNWRKVFRWNAEALRSGRPALVFCSSLSDVFEDWEGQMQTADGQPLFFCPDSYCKRNGVAPNWVAPNGFPLPAIGVNPVCPHCLSIGVPLQMAHARDMLFRHFVDQTPGLWWLTLTKRPQNIPGMLPPVASDAAPGLAVKNGARKNVMLGTSPATDGGPDLLWPLTECRGLARGLFASFEPLLGDPDHTELAAVLDVSFKGAAYELSQHNLDGPGLDWIIGGGETKAGSRPWSIWWARRLRDMTKGAGLPFHWKQNGDWIPVPDNSPDLIWNQSEAPVLYVSQQTGRKISGESIRWPVDGTVQVRIGERQSGRLLDGREWNEFPAFLSSMPVDA